MFGTGALMTTIFRCGTTACEYLHRWSARLKAFFGFAGDPYPETPETIARAKAAAAEELREHYRQLDETPCYRGLGQIMKASQDNVVYFGERKRQLLAKALIEECGQLTGPAFSFERKEK